MKQKLLLIAYRAWGDFLYSVPVLPYLFVKYDVYLETNLKIYQLVYNDPRFKQITLLHHEKYARETWNQLFKERWAALEESIKPDRIINLNGSLEVKCIAESFQDEFYWDFDKRRKHFGPHSFYDAVFEQCDLPVPEKLKLDELYYSEDELRIVENWRYKNRDQFIIILPIAGSTSQKVMHSFKALTDRILQDFPKAVVYLSGDYLCSRLVPQNNLRIKNMCDIPIKQAFLMARYANYVVGPETGVVVAAGMWGTPKTMFCTTSSVYQCTNHQINDYSIQAPISCSPCHRAIYYDTDCHTMLGDVTKKVLYPACTKLLDHEKILEIIDKEYLKYTGRGNFVPHLTRRTLPTF